MVEEFKINGIKNVSPVKVNIEFRTLKAAFIHAVNWGLLTDNPFRKCKQLRIPQKRPAYLTKEDFHLLIGVVERKWYREIIRFALSTMMRLEEIISLRWDSVDIQKRLIYIENTDSFHTKTLKSRVIPIDELTHLALSKKEHRSEYVFTFPDGHPLSKGRVSHLFKVYCRKAGIREEIHFHSLRHTGATWLVQNNVPLFNVQRLLGHSKIEVTEIYSHLEVEHLRKPSETFATFLTWQKYDKQDGKVKLHRKDRFSLDGFRIQHQRSCIGESKAFDETRFGQNATITRFCNAWDIFSGCSKRSDCK